MDIITNKRKELTEDEIQQGVRDYWGLAVEAALRANLYFQEELSADAYHNQEHPVFGRLVAEFDADEYEWLVEQYGQECMRNRDFLMCYRKHRNQAFLAEPSKENFS